MLKQFCPLIVLAILAFFVSCNSNETTQYLPVETIYKYIPAGTTKLTGGVLKDRYDKNIDNLYLKIDVVELQKVFLETHDSWYAEPEFVGHYLAAGPLLYSVSGNQQVLENNKQVVNTIIENQPQSGYLGTYKPGLEFDYTFSVWNQNFLIKGLIAQYESTGNEDALNAATRCADFIASAYLASDTLDLLFGLNNGIQHATILEEMTHLYRITGKKLYLDFAEYIIERLEQSSIQVVSIPNKAEFWAINFMMGCTKGIEMFNIYFGVLEMYRITGDEKYLIAAKNYWRNLREMQIRITGNGSMGEHWNHLGNTPVDLTNDLRPNENCVAMGWMKFNAELAQFNGESVYFDELEKTLYNHIIGSQAMDGHDFSYYQGNIGYKIHEKDPGAYSCCRYRGMRILAYLPGYVYMQSDHKVAVNLYTSSTSKATINDVEIDLEQSTIYPREGMIRLSLMPAENVSFGLMLRKPGWCENYSILLDGEIIECEAENGYLVIDREWTAEEHVVELNMEMTSSFIEARINEQERAAVKYGPLVLAIDSRYGTPIRSTRIKLFNKPRLMKMEMKNDKWIPQVKFGIPGSINNNETTVTLVDYASAGSIEPGSDEFRVWMPVY